MAESNESASKIHHPLAVTRTELVWEGKYESAGSLQATQAADLLVSAGRQLL
jgi:hypothetical protein